MNRLRKFSALVIFAITFTLGACSQDETMDEVITNTEINKPINADGSTGGSSGNEKDKPGTEEGS